MARGVRCERLLKRLLAEMDLSLTDTEALVLNIDILGIDSKGILAERADECAKVTAAQQTKLG